MVGEKDVLYFVHLLEINGLTDAFRLVEEKIKPLAHEEGLSLPDAAWKYANGNDDQDTSAYKLYLVLVHLPEGTELGLNGHKPPSNGSKQ